MPTTPNMPPIPVTRAVNMDDLEQFAHNHKGWLFRGHQIPTWALVTTLERATSRLVVDQIEYERKIWTEYRRQAHLYLTRVPELKDTVEWLALMQHYGAPTRLMDFTKSFWIALFFAIEDAEDDCAVIALKPGSLRPNVPGKVNNAQLAKNITSGDHTDDYLRATVPYFSNERLAIQKGVFVYSMNLRKKFADLIQIQKKQCEKLVVAKALFDEIRVKLNDFNCNSRVLFPGIDGYSCYFQNHTE